MAEPDTLISQSKSPFQDLSTLPPKPNQNPPRPCSNFFSKAIVASVFIALLPLFPFQAPEFINHSIFTRSWELLHLLVVGIAISYGLFSRRNADPPELEKEPSWKSDTTQSYVSQILQVSSVFDDEEAETPPAGSADEGKIQTWSSQYHRRDPMVVVAEKGSDGGKTGSKPLLLPVRSLRTSNPNPNSLDSFDESPNGMDELGNGMNKSSRNERKDCVVLPSPIPWRSRSGRMEFSKEEALVPPPLSAIDSDIGTFKTLSFRSTIPPSPSKNPSAISHSPSPSPESRAKTSEDLSSKKKKSFSMASPPPVPPPPPPPLNYASHSISTKNDTRRSFKEELKDLSVRERGERSKSINGFSSSPSKPEITKPRSISMDASSSIPRSVRTVRFAPTSDHPPKNMGSEMRHPSPLPTIQMEKKVVMVASDDSDGEDDDDESSSEASSDGEEEEAAAETTSNGIGGRGAEDENEVDKKADEFIAKFREQIRLQRIESIKRSTGQRTTRSSK